MRNAKFLKAFCQRSCLPCLMPKRFAFQKMLQLCPRWYSPEDRLLCFVSSCASRMSACARVVDRDSTFDGRELCRPVRPVGGVVTVHYRARFPKLPSGPSAHIRFRLVVFELVLSVHRFRLSSALSHLRDDFQAPRYPRIAAPKRPRDPAVRGSSARTPVCRPVVGQRTSHAPHGGRGKTRAVC